MKYTDINQLIKKAVRKDKPNRIEDLAQITVTAAATGNLEVLYNITKQLANKNFINSNTNIRDKNNTLHTTSDEQMKRWHEHFTEVLTASLQEKELKLTLNRRLR